MYTYFPERLKSARQMRGLSLRELSDLVDGQISRQAISQYENGAMLPTHKNYLLLCQALSVTPDFFSRSEIELTEVEFRKLSKLPVKDRNKIEALAADFLSRYLELEEFLGEERHFVNPIPENTINSLDDVEEAAQMVRKIWDLGEDPIYNIVEILEEKGLKVFETEAHSAFSGMAAVAKNKNGACLIVLNSNSEIEIVRKRFTALHELGHIILNIPNEVSEKIKEKYCHYFANAMLIPRCKLESEIGGKRSNIHIGELLAIKERYGISMQALLYRTRQLGYISEHHFRQQMHYIIQKGWKLKEPGNFLGIEHSDRMLRLLYRGVAEEIISSTKAASLYGTNLAAFRRTLTERFKISNGGDSSN